MLIPVDDRAGGVEHSLGGAIVLLQQVLLRHREILLEAQHIAVVGPTPAIDGLVLVADHEDIQVVRGQQLDEAVLGDVGILELVDQDVLEAPGVLFADGVVLVQQLDHPQQQVVEVDGVALAQKLVVALVDAHDHLFTVVARGDVLGHLQLVLGSRDGRVDAGRAIDFIVEVQLFKGALDQGFLIVGVHDDEVRVERQVGSLAAQNAGANGVEGTQPDVSGNGALALAAVEQVFYPIFHLAGGLVGEGNGQDVVRAHAHIADQVRDALGEHARLAGAWPGQHEHLSKPGGNRLSLLFVEVG